MIASIAVVSSWTLSRLNVGRYSLEKLGRLQPSVYFGVSFSRTVGVDDGPQVLAPGAFALQPQAGELAGELRGEHEGRLDEGLAGQAGQELRPGDPAQDSPDQRAERPVGLRQAPDRGALEDRQVLDLGGDRRDQLDRRCASADDADPLAAQLDRVIPARRVHRRPGERLDARDLRWLWLAEDAGRPDHETCRDRLAAGRLDVPDV